MPGEALHCRSDAHEADQTMSLAPEIQASHDKVAAERTEIYMREKNRILDELDKMRKGSHFDPDRDKHQDTIDRLIGKSRKRGKVAKDIDPESIGLPPRKRGRPKGSKNRVKVSPEEIGTIPTQDIVILRR